MSEAKTLFVVVPEPKQASAKTAGEEPRVCPIHRNSNPHGGEVLLRVGDDPIEVLDDSYVRRRIRSGDLREATDKDKAEATARAKKRDEEAKAKAEADAKAKAEAEKKTTTK